MVTAAAPAATVPSCFGFSVDSAVPLRFARCGGGDRRLRVAERKAQSGRLLGPALFEVHDRGRRMAQLRGRDGEFEFDVVDVGCYRVVPADGLIEVPAQADPIRRELVMWGVPATLCFSEHGGLSIHAAAVEVDGGAVLLAAPGHHGKTTLAVAFHRAGHRILTEDSVCCSFVPDIHVRPGPGLVRVRGASGDIPAGLEPAQTRAGRTELAIAPERRGDCSPVPVRAVVFLREADTRPRLTPRVPHEALRDLWALHFAIGGPKTRARSFERITDLAHRVPCWDLARRLDPGLLGETVERIVEAAG
jgi:hypothetical protein